MSANDAPRWELWLPAMPGPPRKRTKTIAGVKYTTKERRLELPPNANDRTHWRHKGPWVKALRAAAKQAAKQAGIPCLERVRIGAVIRRERIGQADADNDTSRLKNLIDGLVDAKVVPNDTYRHVEIGTVTEERGPVGVLLIVEAA